MEGRSRTRRPQRVPTRPSATPNTTNITLQVSVLIVGAGPTGLGAATRLHQHGRTDWLLIDQVCVLVLFGFGIGRRARRLRAF